MDSKSGRTQPLLAGFQFRGESTEGLLGGWLAQRQAALREVMAAGALPTFTLGLPCVPVFSRAACVPRKSFSGKLTPLGVKGVGLWSIGLRSLKALHCRQVLSKTQDLRPKTKYAIGRTKDQDRLSKKEEPSQQWLGSPAFGLY